MVTLIKRPIGHKLSIQSHEGTAFDYAGDVGISTGIGHGLSDGDYVYIDSNIDAYNGFRYVDSVAYNVFKIKDSENGEYIKFKQAVELNFYISVLNHYWQCVHLPIVYELSSDISPNNIGEESYLPNTVVSYSDNAGYVQLTLSQALSDPEELTKIEIVGGTMAGVYQILTVIQPWSVVIDLGYDASYSFSGSVVVKYYDNYAINVNVYAGFESTHPWESVKPFELAATLKFIPDSDNKVKFSIAEILKGYIETRNKLDLDTLPNNTDFMVSFYISYFETYDQSDGEEITTFTSSVTTDGVIGYAVNAMLEFKNQNSGHMSEYVSGDGYLAQWLTLFDRPIIIIGQFFDISLINNNDLDITITNFKSFQGVVLSTDITQYANVGKGVIRIPLAGESGYDQYCIQASASGSGSLDLSGFLNHDNGGNAWTLGSNPSVVSAAGTPTDILYIEFNFTPGLNYTFLFNMDVTGGAVSGSLLIRIYDSAFNAIEADGESISSGGNYNVSISFTATAEMDRIGILTSMVAATRTVDVNSGSYTIESAPITEQICMDVLEECGSTFNENNYRLTEGDDLRALE